MIGSQWRRELFGSRGALSNQGVPRPPKNANFWVLLHFYVTIFEIMGCPCTLCTPPYAAPESTNFDIWNQTLLIKYEF